MPVVSPKESSDLLAKLESPTLIFWEALDYFLCRWQPEGSSRFQAACYLLLALEEGLLLSAVSRVQALQLLFHLSVGQQLSSSPFFPFLLQASQDQSRPLPERAFIQQLFLKGTSLQISAAQVYQESLAQKPSSLTAADLWQAYTSRAGQALTALLNELRPVLVHGVAAGARGSDEAASSGALLKPPYIRHKQPIMEVQRSEIPWQHLQLPHLLRWDTSMAQVHVPLKELQSLLKSALLKPLPPPQQQQVLRELELERKIVLLLDLATEAIPQLVEHNPVIAFEVLVRLFQLGCKEYLPPLVNMEVSVHSMEVINRLSTAACLPPQFVHLYISNCIHSCQAAQDDKLMQLRRVRLVCVFLQSLIRNNIINVQDLSFEAQAFCIEFSRVREAAALFRLLKTLENGPPAEGDAQQA